MHPFSTPWKHQKTLQFSDVFWCFQGVEKGCIGNEWVWSHTFKLFWFHLSIVNLHLKNYPDSLQKIFKSFFTLHHSISTCKKPHWVTQLLLRYSCFYEYQNLIGWELFFQYPKIYKPSFTFLRNISAWEKSNWFINSHLGNCWFRNLHSGSPIAFLTWPIKIFKSTFIFHHST